MNRMIFAMTVVILCSCMNKGNGKISGKTRSKYVPSVTANDSIVYLKKLSITGDFDGDGKTDTIHQDVVNRKTHKPIDSFPSAEWDSIQNYFGRIDAEVILTTSDKKSDTLHLASGGGLYCLINLGDVNHDHKDEIALVLNNYSFTNISTCEIYTLCGRHWQKVKSFRIHQDAFDYEDDNVPNFSQIKGYLEYRKSRWYYIDYEKWFNAETDKDTVLQPLKIKTRC